MALSDIKYITGDNLSKIGVSQFPGQMSVLKVAEVEFKALEEAVVGTYIIAMDQTATNGKVLYFNGELNSKGALMTTEKADKAVSVVVEVVEGGYTLKVGDKYLEGYLNGTYKNLRLVDNAAVWTWNADAKVFVCDIEGTNYYFGDRDRGGYANDTMALSDIKYITGDNLSKIGVSQFPGQLGNFGFVSEGETPEVPETPETPENKPALETEFETTSFTDIAAAVPNAGDKSETAVYAIGYVKEVADWSYSVTLEDAEGNTLATFQVKSFDGALKLTEIPYTIEKGTILVLYGYPSNYKGTVQLADAVVVQIGTEVQEDNDNYKLARAAAALSLAKSYTENFELPVEDTTNNATITWASSNAAIVVDGANATVTQGAADVTGKLTATVKVAELTKTVEFDITVPAAALYSHIFAAGDLGEDTANSGVARTVTLSSVEWTFTPTWKNAEGYFGSNNDKGVQVGSGSKPMTNVELSATLTGEFSTIVVNASTASSATETLTVYVDGVQVGETITLTSSAADYTFTLSAAQTNGIVKLVFEQSETSKALYIKQITVK